VSTTLAVQRLDDAHVGEIVDVLCSAFVQYPVMQYVLGDAAMEGGGARLQRLIDLFVRTRVLRREPMLGVRDGSQLAAVAILSNPHVTVTPAALASLRATVWEELGDAARSRYATYSDACRAFDVDVAHIHLNMIGVRQPLEGRGFGRRLMEAVDRLARDDADCHGISLTTENPANLSFYEHLGYRNVGHVVVAPELESWGFFRSIRPVAS